jgi:hypothetical protein
MLQQILVAGICAFLPSTSNTDKSGLASNRSKPYMIDPPQSRLEYLLEIHRKTEEAMIGLLTPPHEYRKGTRHI